MSLPLPRAREIVAACTAHEYVRMGISQGPAPDLTGYTLLEMVQAQQVVRAANTGSSSISMVCDDRLVAALYLAANDQDPGDPPYHPRAVVGRTAVVTVQLVKMPTSSGTLGLPDPVRAAFDAFATRDAETRARCIWQAFGPGSETYEGMREIDVQTMLENEMPGDTVALITTLIAREPSHDINPSTIAMRALDAAGMLPRGHEIPEHSPA